MIGDTWPYCVPLQEDELLSSFLIRNARAHGTTPYCFMSYYWPGRHFWDRDTDRAADADWLKELGVLAGVPAERLEASTLLPFRRVLGSTLRSGDTPLLLAVSLFHRTRRRHGLQFCPACFAEGRQWFRRIWRLGFVFVCPEHQITLLDACPACGAPVVPHRSLSLDQGRCHQCGAFLAGGIARQQPITGVLEWQKILLDTLMGVSDTGPFERLETFTSVRALLSVLTARCVLTAIRDAFHLSPATLTAERLQFEHVRTADRAVLMETLAAWLSDWPSSFRIGANAAHLTQRTFHRLNQSSSRLRQEVERLPVGGKRDRRYVVKVLDAELVRLARVDKKAYRALRARRLQALSGLS
ncbi:MULTISPECIES: TniQ family protein [unclassified Ectothiorhodospira]|uniref:TniQ family protein n=1 Tax=unclassified Ectothiorhodospira TaxID=2684909 RepID=UPI001EE93DE3|nr:MULTISPECIES: TniQ family protein [unclassified Ectothiorhodospira]MCG5514757.1 TniQ family protein [Ectothiorhodospira sp. 9100]MCG5518356.1 TniQ family protein [Ectothiorhodospira sp. 9905]